MLVLNLCCAHDHGFEAWFASASEFERQQSAGLIACPLCGDAVIRRMPSAPRLNVSHLRRDGPVPKAGRGDASGAKAPCASAEHPVSSGEPISPMAALQVQVLQAVRKMAAECENVGARFADEARRIHYGEVAPRSIRGQASHAESEALLEEGIAVLPLPDLPGLKETLQ